MNSKQRLQSLSLKCGFIAAKKLDNAAVKISETQKAVRHLPRCSARGRAVYPIIKTIAAGYQRPCQDCVYSHLALADIAA
jgi:hypothetical protein